MNPYGVQGGSPSNQGSDAYMFPGWGSVQSGYQGSSPYGPQGKPTWMGSINQLASPFSKDPYWGNPVDNNGSAFQSIGAKPADAAAWIGQRIAMPAAVFGASSAMFTGMGRSIGTGLARGLFGPTISSLGVGAAAGVVGSFGLPYAIGSAAAHAVDAAVFQPYIRTRQETEDITRNFSGIAFGGTSGNPISGRGISNRSASTIASGIDRAGVSDMTFSANQMHSIAGMGMRAGLFDDVGAGQIQGRVKDIAAQVKLLVAISKDPNIQSAIEQLSQLRAGGASISGGIHSNAARSFSQMGMQASAAGVSVQQLMAASQQGQYMYQANGMTPYLGQLAAGNAYAGFSAAFRTGSLSPEVLARMGGLQGATNASLSGQIASARTPYNMLSLYNQNFGGGRSGSSMTDVAQNFGAISSRNPVQAAGGLLLYGPTLMSKQSRDEGSRAAEDQAIRTLRSTQQRPAGPGGKYSPEQVAVVLQQQGMSPDEVRAYAAQRANETDPTTLNARLAGINAQGKEQMMQTITQEGLYNGNIGRAITSVRQAGHSIANTIADNGGRWFADEAATGQDWIAGVYAKQVYGKTMRVGSNFEGGNQIHGSASTTQFRDNKGNVIGGGRDDLHQKLYDRLNKEARRPGALGDLARKILTIGNLKGTAGKQMLSQFAQDAGLDEVSSAMETGDAFYKSSLAELGDAKIVYGDKKASTDGEGDFKLPGTGSVNDSMTVAGQARQMILDSDASNIRLGTNIEDMLKDSKYAALANSMKGLSAADMVKRVKGDAAYSLHRGYRDGSRTLDPSMGVDIDADKSVASIARMVRDSKNTSEAAQALIKGSATDTAWVTMTANMKTFDGAVTAFATAVAAMPGAKAASEPSIMSPSTWDNPFSSNKTKTTTPGKDG